MLAVGRALLEQAAPGAATQFGFHLPPFNSVDHLHLHCFALPFTPAWKAWKYSSPGGAHIWYLPVEALLRVRCLRCVLRSQACAQCKLTHAPRRQRLRVPRGGAGGSYGALDDAV